MDLHADRPTTRFPAVCVLILAFIALGCAQAAPADGSDRADSTVVAEIRARAQEFSRTVELASSSRWALPEVAAIADFFTEDAIIAPPHQPPVKGRREIQEYWTRDSTFWYLEHSHSPERLQVSGELVMDFGTWAGATLWEHEPWRGSGSYLAVWRRGTDGVWRMEADMFHYPIED